MQATLREVTEAPQTVVHRHHHRNLRERKLAFPKWGRKTHASHDIADNGRNVGQNNIHVVQDKQAACKPCVTSTPRQNHNVTKTRSGLRSSVSHIGLTLTHG